MSEVYHEIHFCNQRTGERGVFEHTSESCDSLTHNKTGEHHD